MVAALIEAMENVHLGPPATCHWHHAARTARTSRVGALKFEKKDHAQSTTDTPNALNQYTIITPFRCSRRVARQLMVGVVMNDEVDWWVDTAVAVDGAAADGFGMRGVRFTPQAGGTYTIKVQRGNLAKRLGRLTGAGLFA